MGENALEYGKSFSRQNRGRPTTSRSPRVATFERAATSATRAREGRRTARALADTVRELGLRAMASRARTEGRRAGGGAARTDDGACARGGRPRASISRARARARREGGWCRVEGCERFLRIARAARAARGRRRARPRARSMASSTTRRKRRGDSGGTRSDTVLGDRDFVYSYTSRMSEYCLF